jgi:hypothetical protein
LAAAAEGTPELELEAVFVMARVPDGLYGTPFKDAATWKTDPFETS